jgi:hypothetical protein
MSFVSKERLELFPHQLLRLKPFFSSHSQHSSHFNNVKLALHLEKILSDIAMPKSQEKYINYRLHFYCETLLV